MEGVALSVDVEWKHGLSRSWEMVSALQVAGYRKLMKGNVQISVQAVGSTSLDKGTSRRTV